MGTQNYRTRTDLNIKRNNGKIDGVWCTGLDLGYSAVKMMTPNKFASFPSYAKRINNNFQYAGEAPETSIVYRDLNTDEAWIVGEVAQNLITPGDTSDSEMSLYGRSRYGNPMFKVLVNAGLGISQMENEYGSASGCRQVIQTGLPANYMMDESDLKDTLQGKHDFALRVGRGDWEIFHIDIARDDIDVMPQPKGALYSVSIDKNGQFVPDAVKYLNSGVLVFDPGFGTLDLFPIVGGTVEKGETSQVLGMKRVLQETVKAIRENYDVEVQVAEMQKYLETGKIPYVNMKTFTSKEYDFSKLLIEASDRVCEEAISWMTNTVDLRNFQYMIITGGTGAAWETRIREKFKGFTTLKLISGNVNDTMPMIYSNVRGYYLSRFNKLLRQTR